MAGTGMDIITVFGCTSAFITVVLLGYRRELRTRLPVIALGLLCCTTYGFLAGVWPVGFVLLAVTASEFRSWWYQPVQTPASVRPCDRSTHRDRFETGSRIHRMFGPA